MPIPAPESWENAVPPYGIRVPKPTAPAYRLPTALTRIGQDVSAALADFGLPPVVSGAIIVAASASARDAHWGIPASSAQRLALQAQGATTIRTDLGITERYFAATTDGGSNPGGRPTAGWYPEGGEDTGWVTLPLAAGWTGEAGRPPQIRRLNGVVYARGRAAGPLTNSLVATLPVGFRPEMMGFFLLERGGTSVTRGTIDTNGQITQTHTSASSDASQMGLMPITFPVG